MLFKKVISSWQLREIRLFTPSFSLSRLQFLELTRSAKESVPIRGDPSNCDYLTTLTHWFVLLSGILGMNHTFLERTRVAIKHSL